MLVIVKPKPGKIEYASERVIDGKRVLKVHRRHEDGTETDEWTQMPDSDRPLLCIPNIAGDLDDIALRDILQSFYGRRAAKRTKKPDITTLYHEFNERRKAEQSGRQVFAMGANNGHADD